MRRQVIGIPQLRPRCRRAQTASAIPQANSRAPIAARIKLCTARLAIFLAFHCPARGGRLRIPFGVAGAIRLHRALTRHPLPSDRAPAREMDGTRTLAAPQAGGEPVTPIQAQDQGVVSLVEKHPSEPCARPEQMRR